MDTLTDRPPAPPTRPPRARALWWTLGSILAVGSIWWGGLNVVALLGHEEHNTIHTYPAAGVSVLDVQNDNGRVVVTAAAPGSDTITVRSHLSSGLKSPSDEQQVVDGRLVLRGNCPWLALNHCDVAYRVEVPRDVTVTVSADNGDVSVNGLGGRLQLHSDSGDVGVVGSSGAEVSATSDSGDVDVTSAVAPTTLTATSDSGDVHVRVPDDGAAYRVDAHSDSGGRNLGIRTDPAAARMITARSDSGDVSVTYG